MSTLPQPPRERQALEEVGHTKIGPRTAFALALVFLATLSIVPIVDTLSVDSPQGWLRELADGISSARAEVGWRDANVELRRAIERSEQRLEDTSLVRRHVQSPVQWALTSWLGAGNEQAYPGAGDWLFYREDVDYVTGTGFLEPATLRARAGDFEAWEEAPQPDPLPALVDLRDQLADRDIDLVLLPTPVKASVHPESFTRRASSHGGALQNRSWPAFLGRLQREGLHFVDLAAPFREAALAGEQVFLHTDTHWSPTGLEIAAEHLAADLRPLLPANARPLSYRRQPTPVDNLGDTARLLGLPEWRDRYLSERVTVQRLLTATGRAWRPDPSADLLLLGDSFSNIYSDAALGWGTGAGLAEQLAFRLRRPVDRVAVNAGGAYGARRRLADDPSGDRLTGKSVVVYQFATRELAFGDWRPIAPTAVD
jgi:alginate O-acetyltransferase complex protein AlgJ